MKIELWSIDRIAPYDRNPRINDPAVDAVARSIQEFGFRQPLVVDKGGIIVVGHTRYKAALQLGLKKVPVHVAKDLTPKQAKAYRLADNATASLATWDNKLLSLEVAGLRDLEFDVSLLGFSEDELAGLFGEKIVDGNHRPRRHSRAAGRSDHAARRPVDSRRPPPAVRRQQQARGRRSTAGRREIHLVNTDPPYNVRTDVFRRCLSFQATSEDTLIDNVWK